MRHIFTYRIILCKWMRNKEILIKIYWLVCRNQMIISTYWIGNFLFDTIFGFVCVLCVFVPCPFMNTFIFFWLSQTSDDIICSWNEFTYWYFYFLYPFFLLLLKHFVYCYRGNSIFCKLKSVPTQMIVSNIYLYRNPAQ